MTKVQRKRASKVLLANTRGMRSWTLCEVLCPELELQASSQLAQYMDQRVYDSLMELNNSTLIESSEHRYPVLM